MTARRPKGTGSIAHRDGRWQARFSYRDSKGVRRSRAASFDTKTAARKWLTEKIAEVGSGQVVEGSTSTVAEYLSVWLSSLGMAQLEAATLSWYRSAVVRHIVPELGHLRLDRLTPVMIEAFLAEKAASGRLDGTGGLGPASVRRLQVTIHKALDAAVRKGILSRNPSDLADRPKLPPADVTVEVWTADELARFIEATSTVCRPSGAPRR